MAKEKLVILRKLPSRLYAQMLQEALEKEGIYSLIQGADIGIMLGSFSTSSPVEVTILVSEEEKQRAEQIAAQILGDL